MTEISSQAESRWECIARHIRAATRRAGTSVEDYSIDVLREWQSRTPAEIREAHGADFKQSGSAFQLMSANGQKIRRWLNPEVSARPSLDVEECLVMALPEPSRSECLRDLTARFVGLFVPVVPGVDLTVGDAATLMRETAEALQSLSDVLAVDGKISATDSRERLLKARGELVDVQAASAGFIAHIDIALEQQLAQVSTSEASKQP